MCSWLSGEIADGEALRPFLLAGAAVAALFILPVGLYLLVLTVARYHRHSETLRSLAYHSLFESEHSLVRHAHFIEI